jgi:tRNA modification GTPase
MRDTIFALATGLGRAAVAVVRLSGPDSDRALAALAGALPSPRYAALKTLRDPRSGERLDQALALWFPGPASFTGEDQVELHLHGGRAVVDAVLRALAELGLRPAEAGEFTRRAFENGKLDLLEAEGVADLIDAETEGQRRQALDQLNGALRGREARWRTLLVESLGLLEASIDFPDEEVPGGVVDQALATLRTLRGELTNALADPRGERVRDGFRAAILGRPNAGKSSLLNAMARRDAAIVTPVAGTTRDIIEVSLDLAGYRVILADTAGLRETVDVVEAEGVRRGRGWAESAALRLFVVDISETADVAWEDEAGILQTGDVIVLNKVDQGVSGKIALGKAYAAAHGLEVVEASASLSVVTEVETVLRRRVVDSLAGNEAPTVTRVRHRDALAAALVQLDRALAPGRAAELVAEDVRLVSRALARLAGRIGAEDVLDKVFASFCIGK